VQDLLRPWPAVTAWPGLCQAKARSRSGDDGMISERSQPEISGCHNSGAEIHHGVEELAHVFVLHPHATFGAGGRADHPGGPRRAVDAELVGTWVLKPIRESPSGHSSNRWG